MDSVTRVRYQPNPGFLERMGRSVGGMMFALALLVGGCALLFWNEGRAVHTARTLAEGVAAVRELELNGGVASPDHDDELEPLVHLSGPLESSPELYDRDFGVRAHAVFLRRHVDMFQWVEHRETREEKVGGQTRQEVRFTYTTEWRDSVIDSRGFERFHSNPRQMPVQGKKYRAKLVKVRGLELSEGLVNSVNSFHTLRIEHKVKGYKNHDDYLFHGEDPFSPEVGDVRVKFEVAGQVGGEDETVSIVARKKGDRLTPFQTRQGGYIELLYSGQLSAKQMFEREMATNSMTTWAIRLGGWFLLFIAFSALTDPIRVLVDWLPVVRELVAMGLGTLNFFLSCSLSVVVIALGWIRYRPLLGWALVLIGISPYLAARFRRNRGFSARSAHGD